MLNAYGVDVEAHDDHFDRRTPDDQWLAAVAQRNWVVITKAKRIRFNAAERHALITYRVGCFVVVPKALTNWALTQILVKARSRLEDLAATEPRPFIYGIYSDGSVKPLRLLEG